MKKLFASFALAALLSGSALAQSIPLPYVQSINPGDAIQDVPNGVPYAGNVYATAAQLQAFILGGSSARTGKPVLTSCITGGGTIVGTDNAFILTGGSTASTSCVATFALAYNSIPVCTVASQTAPGTTTPSYTVTKTAVTITQASNSSEIYDVICLAQPGG